MEFEPNRKFSEKSMFSSLKAETTANFFLWQNPTKFSGLTQNPEKIIGTPNQSIRTKI
jgi:hypothetical protein